jgi:hypothetical protein
MKLLNNDKNATERDPDFPPLTSQRVRRLSMTESRTAGSLFKPTLARARGDTVSCKLSDNES